MLTLSLDEYGDFEGLTKTNGPIFIAGLIYDDNDMPGEAQLERNRIKAYYKSVVEAAAVVVTDEKYKTQMIYPSALHSNSDKRRDFEVIRPVKEGVKHSLIEFIKFGTYNGKKLQWMNQKNEVRDFKGRSGKYHLFVMLKSHNGLMSILPEKASVLASDNVGSNLYFHMADSLLSHLIFNNPIIENVNNVWLDIATRTSINLKKNDELYKEYIRLGYRPNACDPSDPNSPVYFSLTNPDVYRTILAEQILSSGKTDIEFSKLHIASIQYRLNANNMEFLYLADSICSYLGYECKGENEEQWLESIDALCTKMTGKNENLIFGYDEIDYIFSNAWSKYHEGDYCAALKTMFEAERRRGYFSQYYFERWFTKIREGILHRSNTYDYITAIKKIHSDVMGRRINSEFALYVFQVLVEVDSRNIDYKNDDLTKALYFLYDVGVTAYCQIGNSKNAEMYFHKCRDMASSVGVESYLSTLNMMVNFYIDYLAFDKAEEFAEENLMYQDELAKLKDLVISAKSEKNRQLAIAHSQKGQSLAFNNLDTSEQEFKTALDLFDPVIETYDYKTTQSFLLHYYLSSGLKDKYLSEMCDYCDGKEKPTDQLKYILEEGAKQTGDISASYALFVFVKGLYLFRRNEVTHEVWHELNNFESRFGTKIKNKAWKLAGHPSELIFKYLRLIAITKKDMNLEQEYADRMQKCLRYKGITEEAICQLAEIEIADAAGRIELRDKMTEALGHFLCDNFEKYKEIVISTNAEERFTWLKQQLTYMYR